MIAKIMTVGSFSSSCRYLQKGHHEEDKKAQLLDANGVRLGSPAQMACDLERHATLRPDKKQVGLHIVLSFSADDADKLDNKRLIQLSRAYMKQMGWNPDETQWVLVRHSDTVHPHVHLLLNQTDLNGNALDTNFCKYRSFTVTQQMAQTENLTIAKRATTRPNTTTSRQKGAQQRLDWQQDMEEKVKDISEHSTSVPDFSQRLAQLQIHLSWIRSKKSDKVKGVVFHRDGRSIRGSRLHPDLAGARLLARLERREPVQSTQTNTQLKPTKAAFEAHIPPNLSKHALKR